MSRFKEKMSQTLYERKSKIIVSPTKNYKRPYIRCTPLLIKRPNNIFKVPYSKTKCTTSLVSHQSLTTKLSESPAKSIVFWNPVKIQQGRSTCAQECSLFQLRLRWHIQIVLFSCTFIFGLGNILHGIYSCNDGLKDKSGSQDKTGFQT